MRIGWISPGGFDRSGVERVIPVFLGLLQRLAARHEVGVFALRQGEREDSFDLCGGRIHEMGGGSGISAVGRAMRSIARDHRRHPLNVLHGFWINQSGFVAVVAARLLRVPVVVSIGGGELARLPEIRYGGGLSARVRFMAKVSLRLAGAVTGATDFSLAPVRETRPDALKVPLGVDTDTYSPREPPAGPPWRLIQVAHLNRVKDQPTLLRAFRRAHAEEPDSRLLVIGEDTLGGAIQGLTKELGVESAVTFAGKRTSMEVANALRESHLMTHSALHEAGPVVFLEAAACGVASVGSAVGYFSDLAPEAASSISAGNHEALGAEVVRLLRNENERERIAARARQYSLEHNADWTTRRFEEIYASLT